MPMPRFYFHLLNDAPAMDEEGIELADLGAARQVALEAARELIAYEVMKGRISLKARIEVEDEGHRPVLTLPFRSAVAVED